MNGDYFATPNPYAVDILAEYLRIFPGLTFHYVGLFEIAENNQIKYHRRSDSELKIYDMRSFVFMAVFQGGFGAIIYISTLTKTVQIFYPHKNWDVQKSKIIGKCLTMYGLIVSSNDTLVASEANAFKPKRVVFWGEGSKPANFFCVYFIFLMQRYKDNYDTIKEMFENPSLQNSTEEVALNVYKNVSMMAGKCIQSQASQKLYEKYFVPHSPEKAPMKPGSTKIYSRWFANCEVSLSEETKIREVMLSSNPLQEEILTGLVTNQTAGSHKNKKAAAASEPKKSQIVIWTPKNQKLRERMQNFLPKETQDGKKEIAINPQFYF